VYSARPPRIAYGRISGGWSKSIRVWQTGSIKRDCGEPIFFILALVDREGPWITFAVKGPARLLGGTTQIDAISGVAAINVQSQAGEVIVEASSPELGTGSVRIKTVENPREGTLS
jgi:hypothetical protein